MIYYESGGLRFLLNIFQYRGSVFHKAIAISLPCAIFTAILVVSTKESRLFNNTFSEQDSIVRNNAVWGGFSSVLGFLIVFRTSQANSRFWEGATSVQEMGALWLDSCYSLISFTKFSSTSKENILRFENIVIRLFSMLHAAALAELEEAGEQLDPIDYKRIGSFYLAVLNPEGLDDESLEALRDSYFKVEMIFQWVQQLIVENIHTGVLSIPPPILTRSIQVLANGMVSFHNALKISTIPYPFPYAQTCDAVLIFHWFLVPFVVTCWVQDPWWGFIFAFVQVFTLWALNFIAIELENPFGRDPNDLDGARLQDDLNQRLRLLLSAEHKRTPGLKEDVEMSTVTSWLWNNESEQTARPLSSLADAWLSLETRKTFQGQLMTRLSARPGAESEAGVSGVSAMSSPTTSRRPSVNTVSLDRCDADGYPSVRRPPREPSEASRDSRGVENFFFGDITGRDQSPTGIVVVGESGNSPPSITMEQTESQSKGRKGAHPKRFSGRLPALSMKRGVMATPVPEVIANPSDASSLSRTSGTPSGVESSFFPEGIPLAAADRSPGDKLAAVGAPPAATITTTTTTTAAAATNTATAATASTAAAATTQDRTPERAGVIRAGPNAWEALQQAAGIRTLWT